MTPGGGPAPVLWGVAGLNVLRDVTVTRHDTRAAAEADRARNGGSLVWLHTDGGWYFPGEDPDRAYFPLNVMSVLTPGQYEERVLRA